jgi:hypothetical protein
MFVGCVKLKFGDFEKTLYVMHQSMVCPRGGGVLGLPTGFDILLKFYVNFPNMG